MFEFLFGKKVAKKSVKYPKGLLKMAKKYKVKLTVKRGSKRVRKSVKTLKSKLKCVCVRFAEFATASDSVLMQEFSIPKLIMDTLRMLDKYPE